MHVKKSLSWRRGHRAVDQEVLGSIPGGEYLNKWLCTLFCLCCHSNQTGCADMPRILWGMHGGQSSASGSGVTSKALKMQFSHQTSATRWNRQQRCRGNYGIRDVFATSRKRNISFHVAVLRFSASALQGFQWIRFPRMVSVVRFFSAPNIITFGLRLRLAACADIESPIFRWFGYRSLFVCARILCSVWRLWRVGDRECDRSDIAVLIFFFFFPATRKLCLSTQLSRRVPDTVTNYFLSVGIKKKKV